MTSGLLRGLLLIWQSHLNGVFHGVFFVVLIHRHNRIGLWQLHKEFLHSTTYPVTEASHPKYITHVRIMSTYLLGLFVIHFDCVVGSGCGEFFVVVSFVVGADP